MVGAVSGSSLASMDSTMAVASALMLQKAVEMPEQAMIRMLNATMEGIGGNIDFYA
ncbi:MAG: hypothetical protein QMD92_04745 [bacterium]|nr:hypothetical protein [bacterium]